MSKVHAWMVFTIVLSGCTRQAAAWKGKIEWPTESSEINIISGVEAGAVLAAAAAVREMIKQNKYPHLFYGCYSPEQGLEVSVLKGPTPSLYYVMLEERFEALPTREGRAGWLVDP